MLDTLGYPHPFFEDGTKYTVFSKELWELVILRKVSLEHAAYILHTSCESLLATAKSRGDMVPKIDLEQAERNLQGIMHGQPHN
jgi:hypothetical protein